jgi:hypothetical protein
LLITVRNKRNKKLLLKDILYHIAVPVSMLQTLADIGSIGKKLGALRTVALNQKVMGTSPHRSCAYAGVRMMNDLKRIAVNRSRPMSVDEIVHQFVNGQLLVARFDVKNIHQQGCN